MTKHRIYLWIVAAACVLLAVLTCASAIAICSDGMTRKAEQPMENIFTPEIVAEKTAVLAPLFFTAIGLLIAGLVLGGKDENAEKPVKVSALRLELAASRVLQPSDTMRRDRARRKKLLIAGRGLFALCMIPVALHLANPSSFPQDDLEGMLCALLRVLLPCTALGLGALMAASVMREKSVFREKEAAKKRLKKEKPNGCGAESKTADAPGKQGRMQLFILAAAAVLIFAGIINGSALDVLVKAITICTECVGLG